MKQFVIIFVVLIAHSSTLFSQSSIDKILSEVEKNNTTLSALRKGIEAEIIGNKTNISLQNPEIVFNYLWGSPSAIGNRQDLSITQGFDFPSVYSFQNQISDLKNEQLSLKYKKQLNVVLLKARYVCIDLIYNNTLKSVLSVRLGQAQNNEKAYKLSFEKGDANMLEYNKASLNLLNISSELESVEIERNTLISALILLNGGQGIDFNVNTFELVALTSDFEQWYDSAEQNNHILSWLKKELKVNETAVKLNKAKSLPKFQAGYMRENVVGEEFQGITLGMTIPLWENKNKVKFSKANVVASENFIGDIKLRFYEHLKALHSKSIAQQRNVNDYRSKMLLLDNTKLLKKALDLGEISLINYLLELSIYYDSVNKLLELERDMNRTVAELKLYM